MQDPPTTNNLQPGTSITEQPQRTLPTGTTMSGSRVKLPQHIKGLLALRNPNPQTMPEVKKLFGVFQKTHNDLRNGVSVEPRSSEGKMDDVEKSWLIVSTAALLTANSPASLVQLYRFSTSLAQSDKAGTSSQGDNAQAQAPQALMKTEQRAERAALMREASLKCAVVVGAPRTINCLGELRNALEEDVKGELDSTPYRKPSSQAEIRERGATLFESIYNPHTEKLLGKLAASHPDFSDFVIQHAYGGLLSNPSDPSGNPPLVTRTLTSAILMACLRTEGGVGPQLLSHVYGILKAPSYKAEPQNDVEKWLSTYDGVEWILKTVDELNDVVRDTN